MSLFKIFKGTDANFQSANTLKDGKGTTLTDGANEQKSNTKHEGYAYVTKDGDKTVTVGSNTYGVGNFYVDYDNNTRLKIGAIADEALKATADGNGDNIRETYLKQVKTDNGRDLIGVYGNGTTKSINVLKTKTFSGIVASADNFASRTHYFGSIKPDSWGAQWHIKYEVIANVTDTTKCTVNAMHYNSYSIVDLYGNDADWDCYSVWNHHANSSYRSIYYHVLYRLKETGFNNGYGHALGIELCRSGYNNPSEIPRNYKINILECHNCSFDFYSTMPEYSAISGTGSTNYNTYTEIDGANNGLRETGDDNIISQLRYDYTGVTAGSTGIFATSLIMQDANNKWHSIVTSRTTDATKARTNIAFRPEKILYWSTSKVEADQDSLAVSGYCLYEAISNIDFRYSANIVNNSTQGLTPRKSVYLVGTMDSNGLFTLDETKWWTQDLPTSEDNKVYIYLGEPYGTTSTYYQLSLSSVHPILIYKNGAIQLYSGYAECATKDSSGNIISSTYIKSISQTASTGSAFKFRGKYGNNNSANDEISIPLHDASHAGLISNTDQTITGYKSFANTIQSQNSFFDVAEYTTTATPVEIRIRTNMSFASGTWMPLIHLRGYRYGGSDPIDLNIVFYIYNNAFCSGGYTSTSWKPTIQLGTWTDGEGNKKIEIGITSDNSMYYIHFAVDVYDRMANNHGRLSAMKGWTIDARTDSKAASILSTTDNYTVPYKAIAEATLADKANKDGNGDNIRNSYLKTLKQVTSSGTAYSFVGVKGNGNNDGTTITIPNASTSTAGLVTNGSQTFTGAKTINKDGSLTVVGTSGFNFSGIESASSNVARSVWFAHSSKVGTPVYNSNFTYNPSTETLTVKNISGNASSATNATSADKADKDGNGNTISSYYLPLSGGTMTGTLNLKANQYADSYSGSLNANNSNIYGVNSIYTADVADGASEGIHFFRDSTHVDTLWMTSGKLLFVPNRALGTNTTAANSYEVLHSNNYTTYTVKKDGTGATGTWGINITGNAATATSATSASQDSNGNIITSYYVNTGSFIDTTTEAPKLRLTKGDGTTNVDINLPIASDTVSGIITTGNQTIKGVKTLTNSSSIVRPGQGSTWIAGRDNAMIRETSVSGYTPFASLKTTNGTWQLSTHGSENYTDDLLFVFTTDENYNNKNNSASKIIRIQENGNVKADTFNDYQFTDSAFSFNVNDTSKTIPSIKAISASMHGILSSVDAMRFRGVLNSTSDFKLPCSAGDTYKVGTAGTYAGKTCQVGDMLICVTDNSATSGITNANWVKAQGNADGAVTVSGNNTTYTANAVPRYTDATGKVLKNSVMTINDIGQVTLNNKIAFNGSDTWLRINEGTNNFTSGIYMGTSIARTDGQFQVGSSGTNIKLSTTEATFTVPGTFSSTLTASSANDSTSTQTTDPALKVSGGAVVKKRLSVKEIKVDNDTANGCVMQYDTTTKCLKFVFD